VKDCLQIKNNVKDYLHIKTRKPSHRKKKKFIIAYSKQTHLKALCPGAGIHPGAGPDAGMRRGPGIGRDAGMRRGPGIRPEAGIF